MTLKTIQEWLCDNGFEQGFKDRVLIAPVVIAAVLLLAGLHYSRLAGRRRQAAATAIAKIQANSKAVDQYRDLMFSWNALRKESFLPEGNDPVEWIQVQVSSYARSVSMEIVSFNPGGAQSQGNLKWQQGVFEIRGSYNNLGRFMASIENSRPFIGVTNMSLGRAASQQGAGGDFFGAVTARLDMFVFMEGASVANANSGGS